jgi:hypothetical protein
MIYRIPIDRFVAGMLSTSRQVYCDGAGRLKELYGTVEWYPGKPAPAIPAGAYIIGMGGKVLSFYQAPD